MPADMPNKYASLSPSQSAAAELAATTAPGVVRVVNMLKVTHPRPDREIEKDIVFYLKSSSLVNLDDLEYTVKDGDFLTTVSAKTGLSIDRLRELNPGLDANALRVGQKIRLAPPAPR